MPVDWQAIRPRLKDIFDIARQKIAANGYDLAKSRDLIMNKAIDVIEKQFPDIPENSITTRDLDREIDKYNRLLPPNERIVICFSLKRSNNSKAAPAPAAVAAETPTNPQPVAAPVQPSVDALAAAGQQLMAASKLLEQLPQQINHLANLSSETNTWLAMMIDIMRRNEEQLALLINRVSAPVVVQTAEDTPDGPPADDDQQSLVHPDQTIGNRPSRPAVPVLQTLIEHDAEFEHPDEDDPVDAIVSEEVKECAKQLKERAGDKPLVVGIFGGNPKRYSSSAGRICQLLQADSYHPIMVNNRREPIIKQICQQHIKNKHIGALIVVEGWCGSQAARIAMQTAEEQNPPIPCARIWRLGTINAAAAQMLQRLNKLQKKVTA